MKQFFLSMVALMVATMSFSQTTLVATLSHGEDVTMFYGIYAFQKAMDAAVSGDIINLSGGSFQSTIINKTVTLRGAGIDAADPTYIANDFIIDIPTNDTGRLSMEGIRCTGHIGLRGKFNNLFILKCQFSEIGCIYGAVFKNIMIANSKVINRFGIDYGSSVQFINSYVSSFDGRDGNNTSASFVNCVIDGKNPLVIRNSQLVNCIICSTRNSLPNTSVALNCVSVGNDDVFNNLQSQSDCQTSTYEEIFKDFDGTYSDNQTFELTDAAKSKFLGTDGTEVGMYGGMLPYSSNPSYPLITKMNVSKKTTADGKLSVEIEVSAAQ